MSSQWLSVEDHHEHDKLYQPIVDRRAQKWHQILAENDGKWPEPSSKCKYAGVCAFNCQVHDFAILNLMHLRSSFAFA